MIVVQENQRIQELIGEKVAVTGVAINYKAGPVLRRSEGDLWGVGEHWRAEVVGKQITVIGILKKGISPMDDFPVATQDENGLWSQGRGGSMTSLSDIDSGFINDNAADPIASEQLEEDIRRIVPKDSSIMLQRIPEPPAATILMDIISYSLVQ